MVWKRLKVFWWSYKLWIWVSLFMLALTVGSIVGLAFLDSYARLYIIATMPLEMEKMMVYSFVGAWFFMILIYRYGMPLSSGASGKLKSGEIQVTFKDVIGLSEAKRE